MEGFDDRPTERRHDDDAKHCAEAHPQADPRQNGADQKDHGRPDDVELLFHSQAPHVLQWRGRCLGAEILRADRGEMDVGKEHARPPSVVGYRIAFEETQEVVRGQHRQDHDHGGSGEDAPHAAGVEGDYRDLASVRSLSQKESGDEEARDHEENVDADVAAAHLGNARVLEDNEQYGERPQALDVRTELALDTLSPPILFFRCWRAGVLLGSRRLKRESVLLAHPTVYSARRCGSTKPPNPMQLNRLSGDLLERLDCRRPWHAQRPLQSRRFKILA